MPMPRINASLDELRGQMARGMQHGASPGSSANIMPAPNMQPATVSRGGATGVPTADSVRTHSLALGGIKHLVDAGHIHPTHAAQMERKSRAHIASYKGAKKPAAPATRRFGALGGGAQMPPTGQDDGW